MHISSISLLGVPWQVTIIGRCEEDEILLLASDGLWDVLTNQEAVTLAQRCMRRARVRGVNYPARVGAVIEAQVLVHHANRMAKVRF